ncbi:hypothetical protein ACQZV8_03430 [Magnetococcales bacterium HHB-1]
MNNETVGELPKRRPEPSLKTLEESDESSPYSLSREKITRLLIKYSLIDSYEKFGHSNTPYPFVHPMRLRPGTASTIKEYALHNSALMILLDGSLPRKLHKHFRCRRANRIRKKRIQEAAPDIVGLENYQGAGRYVEHESFDDLVRMLLPLDYALLVQNPRKANPPGNLSSFQLTHFNVKIEQITNNALREMGVYLGYLKGRLYDKGEDFVETLERKFFEYFSFYHNAAGRKSAAALATQLLFKSKQTSTVYISSQQDRRLTLFSTQKGDADIKICQYLLLCLNSQELSELKSWGIENGLDLERDFLVDQSASHGVVVLRVRYSHTEDGLPTPDGEMREELNPQRKWIRLEEETIIPLESSLHQEIDYPVAYHVDEFWRCSSPTNTPQEKKIDRGLMPTTWGN